MVVGNHYTLIEQNISKWSNVYIYVLYLTVQIIVCICNQICGKCKEIPFLKFSTKNYIPIKLKTVRMYVHTKALFTNQHNINDAVYMIYVNAYITNTANVSWLY